MNLSVLNYEFKIFITELLLVIKLRLNKLTIKLDRNISSYLANCRNFTSNDKRTE